MTDTQALEHLDKLLDLDEQARAAQLKVLSVANPPLHSRLLKLLAAALATDGSHVLARPLVEGLQDIVRHAATVVPEAGQTLGGYRLLREIGRGGMSVVWLAERIDGLVKREVALKLPLFVLGSPADITRFEREKDVLAGLTHPHIARLYDAGIAQSGQPFIVLEFIDGMPITAYCDKHFVGIADRLRLMLQICAAVAYAHKHLIVHRDLKPSNILVDSQGQVKLLDFGIAKLLDDPSGGVVTTLRTQQGSSALTPLYAAPEQITQQPISTLTDVYVLGLVLHELLTGVLPYAGALDTSPSLEHILELQLHGITRLPSQSPMDNDAARARALPNVTRLRRALTGDLDTIVQKSLRLAPAQRYGSVESLAEDIRSFLTLRPIAARPAGVRYAAGLFLHRHRNACIATAVGTIVSMLVATLALQQYLESRANAARSAAVRDFMFELVNDAEPNELQPDASVTGKQMLDGAVRRARADFVARPELQGELLGELGRMYLRLGERRTGKSILEEALTVLEASSPPTDGALNKARAHLAKVVLDENDVSRARKLASNARDQCTRRSTDCAKARAYAESALSRIYLMEGRSDLGILAAQNSVQETVRGFGANHSETAIALLSLAIISRNAGQFLAAQTAMHRAMSIASQYTMRAADRRRISRAMAATDLDLGHYSSARRRLEELIVSTTGRSERAIQLRLLATVMLELGYPRASLESADAALALSDYKQLSMETLLAQQARARALALIGDNARANADIQKVIDGLAEIGGSPDAPEVLRARRIRAEILLRAGNPSGALQELESLSNQLSSLAEPREFEHGQVLDLLGCALRELNRKAEALAAYDKARAFLEKALPAGHPFLDRNALYRLGTAESGEQFSQQVLRVKRNLAPTSIWQELLDAALDPSVCARIRSMSCTFVL